MRVLIATLLLVLGLSLAGCQDGGMSKDEMDKAAHSKFDDAARSKMAEGMKQGAVDRQKQESQWADAHKKDLDRINAERAKYGRPPLASN